MWDEFFIISLIINQIWKDFHGDLSEFPIPLDLMSNTLMYRYAKLLNGKLFKQIYM